MAIKLMFVTNDLEVALSAQEAGVDWIFIDIELNGKEERQGSLGTLISRHDISDIKRIKPHLTTSKLLVRVNPIYEKSKDEIDEVIKSGADIVMLPYFKTIDEAISFISYVNGRAETCLLIETNDSVMILDDLLELEGINYYHIGLNDLHQSQMKVFPYELLMDGTVERICKKLSAKDKIYGIGGFGRIGYGDLPAEAILTEILRLGASMAILSRTFCLYKEIKDHDKIRNMFKDGVRDIRAYETELCLRDSSYFDSAHAELVNKVTKIVDGCHRYSVEKLRIYLEELFVHLGVEINVAKDMVASVICAELAGIKSHGIRMIPSHVKRLLNSGYNPKPNFKINIIDDGSALIDGDQSFGPACGTFALRHAIEKIQDRSIYMVLSNNNNTVGSLYYYAKLAAEHGVIAMMLTNSTAAMAPWGGLDKLIGTNPVAFGIPAKNQAAIVLDISMSQVAKSKILMALQEGIEIPLNWGTDVEGHPTSNPKEAILGNVLPLGGHKGYGLALIVDILAGVLSGAGYLERVGSFYRDMSNCMNTGFLIILLNPKKIIGNSFYELMDDYIYKIKNSKPIEGNKVFLPGDIERHNEETNIKKGIQLCTDTVAQLKQYGVKYKLSNKME